MPLFRASARGSYGADGSSGNQPRFTLVAYNLCRELGIWEKQSSCYTQFKSAQNTVAHNIFYNGPRAHISEYRGGGPTFFLCFCLPSPSLSSTTRRL